MKMEDLYEFETGEKAIYRKGSNNYHTLQYVRWIESRYSELSELFKKVEPRWELFNLFLHEKD